MKPDTASRVAATVRVSSVRIDSMLRNRGQDASALSSVGNGDLAGLALEDRDVPFEDLLLLAKHFKRPWPYLLVDAAEVWRAQTRDHRTLGNSPISPEATELLFDIVDGVFEILETAAEVFPDMGASPPTTPESVSVPSDEAGASLRDYLGITDDLQLSNSREYSALRLWSTAVQAQGVFVFQRRLPEAGVRAFSLSVKNQAAVVMSSADTPYARVFSLLHELTHLALRTSGLCDLDQQSWIESYCNAVAAACLLPSGLLRQAMADSPFTGDPTHDDSALRRLSHRLGASQAAVLIALRDRQMVAPQLLEELETRRVLRRPRERSGSRGPTHYDVRISRAGTRLLTGVFEALDTRTIERETAGSLLDVKNHQLDRLRREWQESKEQDG